MRLQTLMLRHDIEPRFEQPLLGFMHTGEIKGVELKCRVQTLSNYTALIAELSQEGPQPETFESYETNS
jgi:hypothetical protein